MIALAVLLGAAAVVGLLAMAVAGFEAAWAILVVGILFLGLFFFGSSSRGDRRSGS